MRKYSLRFKTRTRHHVLLFITTGILLTVFYAVVPGDYPKYLWSMATGYVSIILLAATLLIGPYNVLKHTLNPVSTDIRRDIGIWSGLTGITHIVFGVQVHMGNIWLYFVKAVDGPEALHLRDDLFGIANYTGLVAGLIILMLLLLSNDLSLQMLKSRKWKSLQRWSYVLFILILAHSVMYQILEKRIAAIIIVFALIMLVPVIVQLIGFFTIKANSNK